MQNYTLNKYDFVKFMLEGRSDVRLEDTIFWVSTFPLPVSLVHDIFERRGTLIRTYLNHLHAVIIYAKALENIDADWISKIEAQPNPDNKARQAYFLEIFEKGLADESITKAVKKIASRLMVYGYAPTSTDLLDALSHSGRKYKRMYIPRALKAVIMDVHPQLLGVIATGNRDMFGQPVADEFNIYRMGFSDKLSSIFNEMLDFILSNSLDEESGLANASDIKIVQDTDSTAKGTSPEYGTVNSGSVWEPVYKQASVSAILNRKHPFCDLMKKTISAEEIVGDLITSLAECEYGALSEREKRFYEQMRENVSRKLRQIAVDKLQGN